MVFIVTSPEYKPFTFEWKIHFSFGLAYGKLFIIIRRENNKSIYQVLAVESKIKIEPGLFHFHMIYCIASIIEIFIFPNEDLSIIITDARQKSFKFFRRDRFQE